MVAKKGTETEENLPLEKGVEKYKKAIAFHPDNIEAWQKLGEVYETEKKLDEAVECYQKIIEMRPQYPGAYLKLAKTLKQQNQIKEAIAAYQKAIALKSDLPFGVYIQLGDALKEQSRTREVIVAYQKAIELKSELPVRIYINLGDALSKERRWDEAIVYYRKAITIKPDVSARVYFCLGNALLKKCLLDEAIACYQKAIEIKPDLWPAYGNMGDAIAQRKGLDEAISFYDRIIKTNPSDGDIFYFFLGSLFLQAGQPDKAISSYLQAVRIQPNLLKAHFKIDHLIRRIKLNSSQLDELFNCYQEIIQYRSNLPIAHIILGNALTQQGKLDEAIVSFKMAGYQQISDSHPDLAKKHSNLDEAKEPNFLIIGPSKCGTTSLFHYLCKHPNFLPPIKKEIFFFNRNFGKGLDWYLAHFPPVSEGLPWITGEASTSYINTQNIQERIKSLFPNIKLIALLRNPVKRAMSFYYHNLRDGLETRSFEEAVAPEIQSLQGLKSLSLEEAAIELDGILENWNWKVQPGYLLIGLYVYFVNKWMNCFSREQFLILKSEDFFSNTAATMTQVFEFLSLPDYQLSYYKNSNPGFYDPMDDDLFESLSEFFRPHNQKLEDYLNREFSW